MNLHAEWRQEALYVAFRPVADLAEKIVGQVVVRRTRDRIRVVGDEEQGPGDPERERTESGGLDRR